MSLGQITPHILAFRALAKANLDLAAACDEGSVAQGLFAGLSVVHSAAADDLEAQREALWLPREAPPK